MIYKYHMWTPGYYASVLQFRGDQREGMSVLWKINFSITIPLLIVPFLHGSISLPTLPRTSFSITPSKLQFPSYCWTIRHANNLISHQSPIINYIHYHQSAFMVLRSSIFIDHLSSFISHHSSLIISSPSTIYDHHHSLFISNTAFGQ